MAHRGACSMGRSVFRSMGLRISGRSAATAVQTSPALQSVARKEQCTDNGESLASKVVRAAALVGAGVTGLIGIAGLAHADASAIDAEHYHIPRPHNGILSSYDEAKHGLHSQDNPSPYQNYLNEKVIVCGRSRRGRQVFTQDCSSCHSMLLATPRDLIGVTYTGAKTISAEIEVEDGPNDKGGVCTRPGKPSDHISKPYAKEEAARFANGGAYPPDLSLITKARHNGHNYVSALLAGNREPPAGVSMAKGVVALVMGS